MTLTGVTEPEVTNCSLRQLIAAPAVKACQRPYGAASQLFPTPHRPGSSLSPLRACLEPQRDLRRRCLLTEEHLEQRPTRRHRAPQHRICGPRPNRPTSDQRPKQLRLGLARPLLPAIATDLETAGTDKHKY